MHDVQRVVVNSTIPEVGAIPFNEGLMNPGQGGHFPYELSYATVLPKRKDCVNVLAPNCPSISHVMFAGYRVEPTIWRFGQAAGTAVINQSLHSFQLRVLNSEYLLTNHAKQLEQVPPICIALCNVHFQR